MSNPATNVRKKVDLPDPVIPIASPCGPIPPSASSLRSIHKGSPFSRNPNGIRSRSSLGSGCHNVSRSSIAAFSIPKRLRKLAAAADPRS
ncbi:Uncharacterised protein [Mycobacteroides abscessus subsp. abscessus]|nr:Uncharacterised protein [Mycobacteroides abscessus subsp. abscessus]